MGWVLGNVIWGYRGGGGGETMFSGFIDTFVMLIFISRLALFLRKCDGLELEMIYLF